MYKKDGNLSSHGTNWLETLKEMNLPEDTEVIYDTPNPWKYRPTEEVVIDVGMETYYL